MNDSETGTVEAVGSCHFSPYHLLDSSVVVTISSRLTKILENFCDSPETRAVGRLYAETRSYGFYSMGQRVHTCVSDKFLGHALVKQRIVNGFTRRTVWIKQSHFVHLLGVIDDRETGDFRTGS